MARTRQKACDEAAAATAAKATAKPKAKRGRTPEVPTLDAPGQAPKKSKKASAAAAAAKDGAKPTELAPQPLEAKKRQPPEKIEDKDKTRDKTLKAHFIEKKADSASPDAQKIETAQPQTQKTVAEGWKADSSIQEKHVASSCPSGFADATLQPPKKDEEVKETTTTTDLGGAGGPLQATQQSEKKADIPTEEKICASTGTEHVVDPKSSEDTACENSKPLRMLDYGEVLPTSMSSWFAADDVLSCDQEVERAKKHPSFAEHLKNIQDEVGEEFEWGSPDGDALADLECFILFLQDNNKQGELEEKFWTDSLAAALDKENAKEGSGVAGHGWTLFTFKFHFVTPTMTTTYDVCRVSQHHLHIKS